MITPNKLIALDDSTLSQLSTVLGSLEEKATLQDLYRALASKFDSVEQFMLTLDVLYVLGAIDVDLDQAVISNAR